MAQVQLELEQVSADAEREDLLNKLLQIPVTSSPTWSASEKQQELDNNIQVWKDDRSVKIFVKSFVGIIMHFKYHN